MINDQVIRKDGQKAVSIRALQRKLFVRTELIEPVKNGDHADPFQEP